MLPSTPRRPLVLLLPMSEPRRLACALLLLRSMLGALPLSPRDILLLLPLLVARKLGRLFRGALPVRPPTDRMLDARVLLPPTLPRRPMLPLPDARLLEVPRLLRALLLSLSERGMDEW